MEAPSKTDYPTTDEEDESAGFTIKIPDLKDLVNEFEKDDDYLYREHEMQKQTLNDFRLKGVIPEPRWHIKDTLSEMK